MMKNIKTIIASGIIGSLITIAGIRCENQNKKKEIAIARDIFLLEKRKYETDCNYALMDRKMKDAITIPLTPRKQGQLDKFKHENHGALLAEKLSLKNYQIIPVLEGPPGVGKSTILKEIAMKKQQEGDVVFFLSLKQLILFNNC